MSNHTKPITILVADDDADDRLMIQEAFKESRLLNNLWFVQDGEELMEYLLQDGRYKNSKEYIRPGLILLDLNMPRKDGREVLREIKGNVSLRSIPVVVLTTSKAEEDIFRAYDLGVNSFISKPVEFSGLVQVIKNLGKYWFELVELPDGR